MSAVRTGRTQENADVRSVRRSDGSAPGTDKLSIFLHKKKMGQSCKFGKYEFGSQSTAASGTCINNEEDVCNRCADFSCSRNTQIVLAAAYEGNIRAKYQYKITPAGELMSTRVWRLLDGARTRVLLLLYVVRCLHSSKISTALRTGR